MKKIFILLVALVSVSLQASISEHSIDASSNAQSSFDCFYIKRKNPSEVIEYICFSGIRGSQLPYDLTGIFMADLDSIGNVVENKKWAQRLESAGALRCPGCAAYNTKPMNGQVEYVHNGKLFSHIMLDFAHSYLMRVTFIDPQRREPPKDINRELIPATTKETSRLYRIFNLN